MLAGHVAPGLFRREPFGFERWKGHDREKWQEVCKQAESEKKKLDSGKLILKGWDFDDKIIEGAQQNLRSAGVIDFLSIEKGRD